MKRILIVLPFLLCSAIAGPPDGIEGLLGFTNGDQLHGRYIGFAGNKLRWQRDDLEATPEFELSNIRRVVLRNAKPEKVIRTFSQAVTVHGDRLPGKILSLDDERLVLETEYAGNLVIPRDRLGMLAPNPYGGKVTYHGPFDAGDWEMIRPRTEIQRPGERGGGNEDAKGWSHSGAAWYWHGEGVAAALARRDGLPDSSLIRFHVSWKSRISLAIGFHADFMPRPDVAGEAAGDAAGGQPERPERRRRLHPSDTSIYADVFGNSYVLQLNPTHAMLYRATIDDHGKVKIDRMHANFNNVSLGETGSASVEIRASRQSGEISLFINGEFIAQWSEIGHLEDAGEQAHPYAGKGAGLAFYMQSQDCHARISDIVVTEWNGMPDSARSMQTHDHDIVLLASGTDRFSGKIKGIADGRLSLGGRYGDFVFPLDEIAEVRFARGSLSMPEPAPANTIGIRLHPDGVLVGIPLGGDAKSLRIEHPACGTIEVGLASATILDMSFTESFLDDWDLDF